MRPAYNLDETKGNHEHTPEGIKPVEYEHQEYPKVVNGITVKDEAEEKEVRAREADVTAGE